MDFDAGIKSGAGYCTAVLYGESREYKIVSRCLYVDDIVLSATVNDGGCFVFADEVEGFVNEEVFYVGACIDIDGIAGGCVGNGILYVGVVIGSGAAYI